MPKVRILPDNKEIEVAPGTTLLEASQKVHGLHGSACGAVCACSTCHVWVTKGFDSLSEASDRELDILDKAFDVKSTSRLGCQAEIGGDDVEFVITPESLQTWLDEHPQDRHQIEAGVFPEGTSADLEEALKKYVKK